MEADVTQQRQNAPRILCIHQGYELYGSDRVFLTSLQALRDLLPEAKLDIVLPRPGPLSEVLSASNHKVRIEDIWVARRSNGLVKLGLSLLSLPAYVWRAAQRIRQYDLCYINTSVILDYQLATRFVACPAVVHVHEIPTGLALKCLRSMLRISKSHVVFNSHATEHAFGLPPEQPQTIVLNGVPDKAVQGGRQPFDGRGDDINVLMIGRLNSWKGQDLLLEAAALLPSDIRRRLRIKVAGAAFESGQDQARLEQMVARLGLTANVSFEGFVGDPTPLYQWSDVVAVPSRMPEPFGLVAVEGMVHSRPVIGARIGGLADIIVDGQTGLQFDPGDIKALCACLEKAATQASKMIEFGKNGRKRYEGKYTEVRYLAAFGQLARSILDRTRTI